MSGPEARILAIWFNAQCVGRLREQNGLWALDYDAAWQTSATGFDLAPSLPRQAGSIVDGASQRPVQWFFDNLLPEEGARELLAKDARLSTADAFGLLAWYGRESAGALTLLAPDETPVLDEGHLPLTDEALSERIRQLPAISLTHGAPKKISLAGAQHKLAVVLTPEGLFEPRGNTPSTHILKPEHQDKDNYPHSVINEWFAMTLAKRVGLPVPEVTLRHVPEPVYLIERFDRASSAAGIIRLQTLDACQVLGLDKSFKYTQATPDSLNQLIDACREKARTRLTLYRWVVFNTLIGNDDAHLKNVSFHVEGSERGTTLRLAPHYDLLCTSAYRPGNDWGGAELSWAMGDAKYAHQLTRGHVVAFGEAIGLPARLAERELEQLLVNVEAAGIKLLAELPAGSHAGEVRFTRQIVYGVMRDMSTRLSHRIP